MPLARRSLAPALLLPWWAAQSATALRTQDQRSSREAEAVESSYMREYEANLSHTRTCNTSVDKVGVLAPLVVPSLKLAFCYLPKGACTQFKDLFNRLNGLNASEGFGISYLRSRPRLMGVNVSTITRENGWRFAVFTRDPALRYLSAFGSTCVPDANGYFEHTFECCGPLVKDNTVPAADIVKMFETRVLYDARHGVVHEDDHWVSQTRILQNCGWHLFNPQVVDFRGDLSSGEVNKQVKDMLAMVGGTEEWMLKHVDRLFPKRRILGHRSPLGSIPASMFYHNRTVMRRLYDIYKDDYEAIPDVGRGFSRKQYHKTDEQLDKEWRTVMSKIRRREERQRRSGKTARRPAGRSNVKVANGTQLASVAVQGMAV